MPTMLSTTRLNIPGSVSNPMLRFTPNMEEMSAPAPMTFVRIAVHSSNMMRRFLVQLIDASTKRMLSAILVLTSRASAKTSSALCCQLCKASSSSPGITGTLDCDPPDTIEPLDLFLSRPPSAASALCRKEVWCCKASRRPRFRGFICSTKEEMANFSGYSRRVESGLWRLMPPSTSSATDLRACKRSVRTVTAAHTMHSTTHELNEPPSSKLSRSARSRSSSKNSSNALPCAHTNTAW
mmetsp:Transcript_78544/g.222648  ORF Transcript_78544/g.222648 Transcript_78544/m.222648 type:complete len:239 (+) Transcript_78544:148-864(+)